jgi:hypothetical protein
VPIRGQAQPTSDPGHGIGIVLADHLHRAPPALLAHIEPQAGQERHGVVHGRPVGLADAVQRLPVGSQPRHRVDSGELDHDATLRMGRQRSREPREVCDVVDDVMAHGDVSGRCAGLHVGPGAFDRGGPDAASGRAGGERLQQLGVRIDADHVARRQPQAGGAGAHADVEHGATVGQCLLRDGIRDGVVGTIEGGVGCGREHGVTEEVRRLGGGCDEVVRYGPKVQRCGPAPIRSIAPVRHRRPLP